jgi:uncharacterized membrane protein
MSFDPGYRSGPAAGAVPPDRLGTALGVASLALAAPLLRPGSFAKAIGVDGGTGARTAVALVGARELTAAAGLLASRRRAPWLWARVAGDVMDLALLGTALLGSSAKRRGRTAAATAAVGAIAAVDLLAAARSARRPPAVVEMHTTTTVNKPPQEVYAFWRGLERLPQFMAHVDDVRWLDHSTTHWTVSAPLGRTVEWDARIVEDVPGERLSWRSVDGADIDNEGSVRFVPGPAGRGTEVHVHLRYSAPGGKLGELVARIAGEDPHQQVQDDLRRFKQVMETGEVVRSSGAPSGIGERGFPQSAAQPHETGEQR